MKLLLTTLIFTLSMAAAFCQTEKPSHDKHRQTLELNKGKKWKVHEKMLSYIRAMEKDLAQFENNKSQDYKKLAKKLQKNIDGLTSNCTMKGKAHDELHKWLLPFIANVKALSEEEHEQALLERVAEIKKSFIVFNTYFQ